MACRSSGSSSGGDSGDLGPVANAGTSLSETPCFGTCPEYTMTVFPNEFYQLDSGRFTKNLSCFDAPNKATLATLVAALRMAMDVDGRVVP